jgi:prephenate dehydrogenase
VRKKKLAIIGVGLLGGSLALDLKKSGKYDLVGWNHRAVSRRKAAKILPVVSTFEKAVEGASVVVLCSHTGAVLDALPGLLKMNTPVPLIMDVSSVKGALVRSASKIPGASFHFVPCHPMAGREKSGVAAAERGLYQNKIIFITPLKKSPKNLVNSAITFWKEVGGRPILLDSAEHDRIVALTSHLPHLMASLMVHLYEKSARRSPKIRLGVGSGFRDTTRVAAGSPAMWSDILRYNQKEIVSLLGDYRRQIVRLESSLAHGKKGDWMRFFEQARSIREKI